MERQQMAPIRFPHVFENFETDQDNKSISKYKVTPSEEISSGGNNKNEEAQEQQPTKKKSLLKSITDDTAVFIHEMQNNVSNSIQKAASIKVNFKFHGPELPDEDDFKELRNKLSKFVTVASWCFDSIRKFSHRWRYWPWHDHF